MNPGHLAESDMRVFVDTEYCYPGMKRTDPRPTAKDTRQIVQVAAVLHDMSNNKEIASFDMLAKPAYEKRVTPFFEELTGITQLDIDTKARIFPEVLGAFATFCADYPVWTYDKDEEVFRQNCAYYDIEFPFDRAFTRVLPLLATWGLEASRYSSGTLYTAIGQDMKGHVHNALHDVRSMAAAVRHFEQIGKVT